MGTIGTEGLLWNTWCTVITVTAAAATQCATYQRTAYACAKSTIGSNA